MDNFQIARRAQIGDLGLTTAARDALHAFGAKSIAVITPYPPWGMTTCASFSVKSALK